MKKPAIKQSNKQSPLWHELRYGRITASKAYSVLHCKATEGTIVEGILGACKIRFGGHETRPLFRKVYLSRDIEKDWETISTVWT